MNLSRLIKRLESLSQEERNQFLLNSLCYGDIISIEIAILAGGDIGMYSNYPLKRAIEKNWPGIVQLLVDEGIDVTANNNAALKLAYQRSRKEIIPILEKAGAYIGN